MTAHDIVQQKISEAGEVLFNLQNYSNNTFEVAKRANAALQAVAEITNDAMNVMRTTGAIQHNVTEVTDTLLEAMNIANGAENITVAAQMVCFVEFPFTFPYTNGSSSPGSLIYVIAGACTLISPSMHMLCF